jgi:hypothetical protein
MIVISNLSPSYITEVNAAETSAVIGGYYGYYGYGYSSYNSSDIDIKQLNLGSFASSNYVGSVNVTQS